MNILYGLVAVLHCLKALLLLLEQVHLRGRPGRHQANRRIANRFCCSKHPGQQALYCDMTASY